MVDISKAKHGLEIYCDYNNSITRKMAKIRLEETLMCDGVLDHSYGRHNALPMSYEEIAEWILQEIDRWKVIEWKSEEN